MNYQSNVRLGLDHYIFTRSQWSQNGKISDEIIKKLLSAKANPYGNLLLCLKQYLGQYFNGIDIVLSFQEDDLNVTVGGLEGMVNRSEVDIGLRPLGMDEETLEMVDFAYPYKLHYSTFITQKPKYEPHFFGIFQTFSLQVWIAVASVFIAVSLAHQLILKKKFDFKAIAFHVFAVLMRQNAPIKPSKFAEKMLMYFWVFGAMILCLSHDSVFLSFLSLPPVRKIKNLSELSTAVQKGEYHCFEFPNSHIARFLRNTEEENLRVIADDIDKNDISFKKLISNFLYGDKSINIVLFKDANNLDFFIGNYFISEDRFVERMTAMYMRKDFCCKDMINTFVHRVMASGIYFKVFKDSNLALLYYSRSRMTEIESKRKLTLIDLAPAFIFLLGGHLISFTVFVFEIKMNQKNVRYLIRETKKFRKKRLRKVLFNCFSSFFIFRKCLLQLRDIHL